MRLAGAAPDQLVGDIARFLSQWTGQRWLVSLSEFGGEETLAEHQRESDEKLRDTIANEPLVARILDIFPGAIIDEIKTPETSTTYITTGNDDALLTASADEEGDIGMMRNMAGMMKKMQEMQCRLTDMQGDLAKKNLQPLLGAER